MQVATRPARIRRGTYLSIGIALALSACQTERTGTEPELPGTPATNPQFKQAAFILDVFTRTGQVRITPPVASAGNVQVNQGVGPSFSEIASPNFSILAGDVVQLIASNYNASAVGAFQPGKIRVTFDVSVFNKLTGVQLITPTFPTPPAGTNGIILFPFETAVTVTSGGVSVGGDGTDVILEQPSYGLVESGPSWDGSPHNFFNDTGCGAGANDCYRHEVFPQPLSPGATSPAQSVGFDIDPTVGNFRARLIIAADLANSGPTPVGTVAGNVSSPQRGALSGVTVTVNAGGFTNATDAGSDYSIANVTIGPKTVLLSTLPAGCTDPGSQAATVTAGNTSTVNFTVQCTVPAGNITGTVSSSLGGGLANVSVTVTPTGLAAQPGVNTNGSGVYTAAGVPVGSAGTGSIALGNVPALCTNGSPYPYSGLTDGGTITVNITLSCTPPPSGYQFSSAWSGTGGTRTLTVTINMGTFNNPAVNGTSADDIFSIQGLTNYDASRLAFVPPSTNVPGSLLSNLATNSATPGVLSWGNFTTSPPATGSQGVAVFNFNVIGSGAGSVTTSTSLSVAESANGDNLIPNVIITEGTTTLP